MTSSDRDPKKPALKVLVVEDELLIGMDLVMELEDWGYDANGPHKSVAEALSEIEQFAPDVAILDVNLGNGVTSMPIAKKLKEANIPFVFLTGYDPSRFDSDGLWEAAPRLRKPIILNQLHDTLKQIAPTA
ncbi:response regulator [Henriciella sp. AS95]|uniref:response regulator n=1 Tax=Henriciella sp. AS95 TaxID=3135782 RepID=UPI00317049FD